MGLGAPYRRKRAVCLSCLSALFRGQIPRSGGDRHHHHYGQVRHDPVDIRRRIDRLVARVDRRDDYGQLLTHGQAIHRLEDVGDIEAGAQRSRARPVRTRSKSAPASATASSGRCVFAGPGHASGGNPLTRS